MPKDKGQYVLLDARAMLARIALITAIILALVFGWFAVRWQLGNMLAELTTPTAPSAQGIARLATGFAPRDPLAQWLYASAEKDVSTPEKLLGSINSFEKVVKLSPYDFQWWIELGRAREQGEDYAGAEKAYVRAVELAPHYTYPRWQLGNFYLRQDKSDEAFNELKKAAETSHLYRDQVFSIAWDYYEQDTVRLEQLVGDSPTVKAGLARYYAGKERPIDSLRMWNMLSEEDKKANAPIAKVIAQALYEKRFFRQAVEFVRQLGIETNAKAEIVQNGDFEKPLVDANETYFGWKISSIGKMDIKPDPTKKHEGTRSLRVSFNGFTDPTLFNILQYVAVEPGAKYQLSFWLRTENLRSAGMPTLEVYNANDEKKLATSRSFPADQKDWQQIKLVFIAPQNAEAVGIRTTRDFCGADCPIFGTFWYDDFKLEKIK